MLGEDKVMDTLRDTCEDTGEAGWEPVLEGPGAWSRSGESLGTGLKPGARVGAGVDAEAVTKAAAGVDAAVLAASASPWRMLAIDSHPDWPRDACVEGGTRRSKADGSRVVDASFLLGLPLVWAGRGSRID